MVTYTHEEQDIATSIALELICEGCGDNLTGADVDHRHDLLTFAREATALGWRIKGGDVFCPHCAQEE